MTMFLYDNTQLHELTGRTLEANGWAVHLIVGDREEDPRVLIRKFRNPAEAKAYVAEVASRIQDMPHARVIRMEEWPP